MTIQARYSGICLACGGRWQPGDLIRADETAEGALPQWQHAVCPDDDPLAPDCPVHGEPTTRLGSGPGPSGRRLVVAGVISRREEDPPNLRRAAIVVDAGHPRGPVAATGFWDVEADARAATSRPLRSYLLESLARKVQHFLETTP